MTDTSTSQNKSSVVEDFFSALFGPKSNSSAVGSIVTDSPSHDTAAAVAATPASPCSSTNTSTATSAITTPPSIPKAETSNKQFTPFHNEPSPVLTSSSNAVINDAKSEDHPQEQPVVSTVLTEKESPEHTTEKDSVIINDLIVDVENTGKVLDEFDEYALLSSRKSTEPSASSSRQPHTATAPTPAIPTSTTITHGNSPVQILSKKEIDWSTVSPESRMLIRQLPQGVNKQEVMDYFSKYGEVIEVVQKNSFGFVHFEKPDMCARAVKAENGKIFNGVVLELEICKKKPYFARARENVHTSATRNAVTPPQRRRRDRSPDSGRNRSRSRSLSRSRSPPRQRARKNDSHKSSDRTSYRSRSDQHSHDSTDYGRSRNDFGNSKPNSGNNQSNSKIAVISRKNNVIPIVQIVAWSEAYRGFVASIENLFVQNRISTSSATLYYTKDNRENIVKQMVLEGVKALIMIDRANKTKHKVYLQVFSSNPNGGVRFDEYDSVTPVEAVNIVKRCLPQATPLQSQPLPYNNNSQVYAPRPQYQQQPPINQYYQQQQQPYTPQQTQQGASPMNIDPNTLNTVLSLLQPQNNSLSIPQNAQPLQPSISQLIATLASGLGVNTSSPAQGRSTPQPYPGVTNTNSNAPVAPAYMSSTMNNAPAQPYAYSPSLQQNQPYPPTSAPAPYASSQSNIAALINTATSGNPALATLLSQVSSGLAVNNTNNYNNTPSNIQPGNVFSPRMPQQNRQQPGQQQYQPPAPSDYRNQPVPQTSRPEYNNGAYAHMRG